MKIKNVVFDVGGVMLNFSKIRPLSYIGIWNLLWYIFVLRRNPFKLLDRLLEINYLLESLQNKNKEKPLKFKNLRLTGLIEKALKNEVSSYELLDDTLEKSHIACEKGLIKKRERLILSRFANLLLNPETGVEYLDLSKKCVEIIKKCKANKNIKLYILSNWPSDSFELIEKKYSDTFNLFDGKIISGDAGITKPDKEIYNKLISKYRLEPSECIFIDDQKENLLPAEKIGMKTILWKSSKSTASKLKKYGVL